MEEILTRMNNDLAEMNNRLVEMNNLLAKVFVPEILVLEKKNNKLLVFPKTKRELKDVYEKLSNLSLEAQQTIVFEILQKIEKNPNDFHEDLYFQILERFSDICDKKKGLY